MGRDDAELPLLRGVGLGDCQAKGKRERDRGRQLLWCDALDAFCCSWTDWEGAGGLVCVDWSCERVCLLHLACDSLKGQLSRRDSRLGKSKSGVGRLVRQQGGLFFPPPAPLYSLPRTPHTRISNTYQTIPTLPSTTFAHRLHLTGLSKSRGQHNLFFPPSNMFAKFFLALVLALCKSRQCVAETLAGR